MKILASSNSPKGYYAYSLDRLFRMVRDYLEYDRDEDVLDYYWVEEPIYYAYIANSDMTDIDVAFVSSSEAKVADLNMDNHLVQLVLGGEEYREEHGYAPLEHGAEFSEILRYLTTQGIDVLDDESGTLDHIGEAVLLNDNISRYIDEIIEVYGSDDARVVYDHLVYDYCDKIIDDLYTNSETNIMIVPVKKQHWRF